MHVLSRLILGAFALLLAVPAGFAVLVLLLAGFGMLLTVNAPKRA